MTLHGVEAVDRLVEYEIVRLRADGKPECCLLLHTLGKTAQRLTLVELKNICEGGKAFVAERGVEPLIKGLELADGCARVAA